MTVKPQPRRKRDKAPELPRKRLSAHRFFGVLGLLELAVALDARGDGRGDLDGFILLAIQCLPSLVVGAYVFDLLRRGDGEGLEFFGVGS